MPRTDRPKEQHSARDEWQQRLLPLMSRMVVAFALFFFVASCIQLVYLHRTIQAAPRIDINGVLERGAAWPAVNAELGLRASRLRALVALEANSTERQYHQANVLLMARVWQHYLGFVTGMILALVGAAFILGRLHERGSELTAQLPQGALSLKSASPGLVLAVLGTVLMFTTIVTHHRIDVVDRAVYLRDEPGLPPSVIPPTIDLPKRPEPDKPGASTSAEPPK